jgi:lipopolysaccharide heptosyltransferase II
LKVQMRPIEPGRVRKILVRGTNWIGDAVMSVPALKEIRRLFPQAEISLLVRPWVKDVYSAVDFVDDIIEYDKRGAHQGWRGLSRIVHEIRQRRFDLAILLQNAMEAALIAWWAGIPQRLGYTRDGRGLFLTHRCKIDPDVLKVHQIYYYLGILSGAGLLPGAPWQNGAYRPSVDVRVRDEDAAAARQLLTKSGAVPGQIIVGLNPGAAYGWAKRWLTDRYAGVADELAEKRGAKIVIFGAPEEQHLAREIAGQMRHKPVVCSGLTSLGQLMALIKDCSLFITNDSGPMHLAAALDVPQIAIFGSTSETATGPFSSRALVIKQKVECSPCFLRECPIDFRCMTRISVEQVLTVAVKQLDREPRGFLTIDD